MRWLPLPSRAEDQFGLDSMLLLAYVGCFGILLALLPLDGNGGSWTETGPALGLQLAVGVALVLAGRRQRPVSRPYVGLLGVMAYLASVALLRDGSAPTAGYGPLVLLPVVWASLRGGRLEFLASLVGLAAVYLVPMLVVGAPQYPVDSWRPALLFVVIAAVIGLVVRRQVGRVEELFERLGQLARTDTLTGLPNRRAWQELLERESSLAVRSGNPLTVALLDLDRFKQYNDSQGHLAGDRLLISATAAWRNTLRESDVLARWGGDEFVLLLPNCNARQAEALLERMQETCPEALFSAGVVESGGDRPMEALLATADEDLYRAKEERQVQYAPRNWAAEGLAR